MPVINLLAISGSTRTASSNTALLRWLATQSGPAMPIEVYNKLIDLPIFSTDMESTRTPPSVLSFAERAAHADGIIVSSPEYVRSIPGGLKNAIDWLVSREELIHKPMFLAHASHRGDDMLESLRIVLNTVSTRFDQSIFFRLPLAGKSSEKIEQLLAEQESESAALDYLSRIRDSVNS